MNEVEGKPFAIGDVFLPTFQPSAYRCRTPKEEAALIDACKTACLSSDLRAAFNDLMVPGEIELGTFRSADLLRHTPDDRQQGIDNELGLVRWAADYSRALSNLVGNPFTPPDVFRDAMTIVATMIRVSAYPVTPYDWGNRSLLAYLKSVTVSAAAQPLLDEEGRESVTEALVILLRAAGPAAMPGYPEEAVEPFLSNLAVPPSSIVELVSRVWADDDFDDYHIRDRLSYWAFNRLHEDDYTRWDVLAALGNSSNIAAQYFAAGNVNTPRTVLLDLAGNPSTHPQVQAVLTNNPSIPLPIVENLLSSGSYMVRGLALWRILREGQVTARMVAMCMPLPLILDTRGPLSDPYPTNGMDRHEWRETGIYVMLRNASRCLTESILSEWAASDDPEDVQRASLVITRAAFH